MPENLEQADIVLVGVSRTSKTPTSIYLANRGFKTANIPIVPGVAPPTAVSPTWSPLLVGLIASPERIVQIRQNRLLSLNADTQSTTSTAWRSRRKSPIPAVFSPNTAAPPSM